MTISIFKPRPVAKDWPACPEWCAGDCGGGDLVYVGPGRTVEIERYHTANLYEGNPLDGQSLARHQLKLRVERSDDREIGSYHQTSLFLAGLEVRLNHAERLALIAALQRADASTPLDRPDGT